MRTWFSDFYPDPHYHLGNILKNLPLLTFQTFLRVISTESLRITTHLEKKWAFICGFFVVYVLRFVSVCVSAYVGKAPEGGEVYNESTDCVESQSEKAFPCNTIGFMQIEEKGWVEKNPLLMSKKLQESLNKIELAYVQGTVSKHDRCSRICCFCLTSTTHVDFFGGPPVIMLSLWPQ